MRSRTTVIRCFSHYRLYIAWLAALLAPLTVANMARAGGTLLCTEGTCRLAQDETYDLVIIGPGATVQTHNHTLTIAAGGLLCCAGMLDINSSGALIVQGGSFTSIAGTISLKAASSLLRVTADATMGDLSLAGKIKGEHPSATIDIASGVTLTSQLDIEGTMTISGPGTLMNKDSVVANDVEGRTLELDRDLILDDQDGAPDSTWKASASGAKLLFKRSATLDGDLYLSSSGVAEFRANISFTSGTDAFFTLNYGVITIGNGGAFSYDNYSSSTSCPNPDDDSGVCDSSDPPYEVCSSESCLPL